MDWKDIKPLTEYEAISIVKSYFEKNSLVVERIDPKNLSSGKKAPDLSISKDNELIFFCEVKTPELKINPVTNMYHWDTTFYKLRRFIHTAVKQFKDIDPEHKYPWVVAFTSDHPQLNWTNFTHNVLGAVVYGGDVLRDFRDKAFVADSNKDLLSIDLFLWFQINYINRTNIVQLKRFINKDSKLLSKVISFEKSLSNEGKG